MTDEDIKRVIRTCEIGYDCSTGRPGIQSRNLSDVICRDHCLPCLHVIDIGLCPKLIELFRAESEG